MQATEHIVEHFYQPTANTCGYAALAILLSHYDNTNTQPEQVVAAVPQPQDEDGQPVGSITTQLATWCLSQNYAVNFYSFDCQILDLSWQGLDTHELIDKLEAVKDVRDVAGVGGKYWSRVYAQSYIDMLKAGGRLTIANHPTSKLLYDLLENGPVYVNICSAVVTGHGRQKYPDITQRVSVADDIHGNVGTHSVVIYGNDEQGNFLMADPWSGLKTVDAETLLCGISVAQIECDNQLFQLATS